MQQFAHGRDDNAHLTVTPGLQALSQGPHQRVVAFGDDGGHIEGGSQSGAALFADAAGTADGTAPTGAGAG